MTSTFLSELRVKYNKSFFEVISEMLGLKRTSKRGIYE